MVNVNGEIESYFSLATWGCLSAFRSFSHNKYITFVVYSRSFKYKLLFLFSFGTVSWNFKNFALVICFENVRGFWFITNADYLIPFKIVI